MRLRHSVIGTSDLLRFGGGAALCLGAMSAVLGLGERAAVGGNCQGHADLSSGLACGYGWGPIGAPHGFNGNSTPWEISGRVDDDYFGAIIAGMERWNHQSTSGFFRYHGPPENGDGDNNHLGTFVCTEGANLVRQSRDSPTGWCNMSLGTSQGSDAFTFSACNNRWHIHVCDPAPDIAEAVSAFTHEFGHVNRLCHLENVSEEHAPNNGDVVSIMRSHRSEPGGMSEDLWPSDVYCSDYIWGNKVGNDSAFRKDRLYLFTRMVRDDGRSVWEYRGRLQATDFGYLPADIYPDISDLAVSGGSVVFSSHGEFSLAYIGQGNSDGAGWSIRPLGDLQDFEIAYQSAPLGSRIDTFDSVPSGFVSHLYFSALARDQDRHFSVFARPVSPGEDDPDRNSPAWLVANDVEASVIVTDPEPGNQTECSIVCPGGLGAVTKHVCGAMCRPSGVTSVDLLASGPLRACAGTGELESACASSIIVRTASPVSATRVATSSLSLMAWRVSDGDDATESVRIGEVNSRRNEIFLAHREPLLPGEVVGLEEDFGALVRPPIRLERGGIPPFTALTNAAVSCSDTSVSTNWGNRCLVAFVERDEQHWTNRVVVVAFDPVWGEDRQLLLQAVSPAIPVNGANGTPIRSAADVGLTFVPGNGGEGTFFIFVKPMTDLQHIQILEHNTTTPLADWRHVQTLPMSATRGVTVEGRSRPDVPIVLEAPEGWAPNTGAR